MFRQMVSRCSSLSFAASGKASGSVIIGLHSLLHYIQVALKHSVQTSWVYGLQVLSGHPSTGVDAGYDAPGVIAVNPPIIAAYHLVTLVSPQHTIIK